MGRLQAALSTRGQAGGLVKSNEGLVRAPDGAEVMEFSNKE